MTTHINGDACIDSNLAVGANGSVKGSLKVARNLTVEGWLDAKNIKTPCKGLFANFSDLLQAYPYPRPGWWALIGNALPARLFQVIDSEWHDTGKDWNLTSLSLDQYDQQIDAMETSATRIANLFAPYIVNDGASTIVTTTENITHEVEVPNEVGQIIVPGTVNLLDHQNLLMGYDITSGNLHQTPVGIMSNLITVTPGATYTIENACYYADKVFVAFYNSAGDYVGRVGFTPTTAIAQGTNSAGTQYYGCAVLTVMECPQTVNNEAFTHCRVVLQAQAGSSESQVAMGDLENARIYQGTVWSEPVYSDGTGTHIETVIETITHTQEVKGERLDLSGVCRCANSSASKTVRILSIGNSYSRDSLAYLPYLMPALCDVRTQIGILFIGGASIDTHYNNVLADNSAYSFDFNAGDGSAWTRQTGFSIRRALESQEWDLVLLQQASTWAYDKESYANLGSLLDKVCSLATYPIKFGWLLTQARPSNLSHEEIEANFEAAALIANGLTESSLIDFVIPAGTAVQNARNTSLVSLGDGGELVAGDMIHLQEGLPCMLAAYSAALVLCDMCGCSWRSVIGDRTRATAAWLASKNIPEPNGSVVEGSEEEYLLAQKCAVIAHRFPYRVTAI